MIIEGGAATVSRKQEGGVIGHSDWSSGQVTIPTRFSNKSFLLNEGDKEKSDIEHREKSKMSGSIFVYR